ncbi:lactonase family protein [Leptospira ilyithenensis]|nr:beta-propeller fold lactonase family protein [Leptospira ilyithenensis]
MLNGACDPESKGFLLSLFLKASQGDPSYACSNISASSSESLFEIKYENDFLALTQNETVNEILPTASKSITRCEITPSLPTGLIFDSITCALGGTPVSGQITKHYTITAYHGTKETKTILGIKVLYIPKFAYAGNYTGGNISVYSINPTSGALTNLFTRTAGGGPNSLSFTPDNRFLAVANRSSQNVNIFSVNQTNGDITLQFTEPVGLNEAIALVYHPSGNYLYVCTSLNVQTFSVNQLTGAITNIGSIVLTGGTSSVAIDPIGKFLYVSLYGAAAVAIFKISEQAGLLSATEPPTISSGIKPRSIDILGNGKTLYVLNETDKTVNNYKIDASTGLLQAGTPLTAATGLFPLSLNADPKGRYVYVANEDSNNISIFKVNQTNGSLTAEPQTTAGLTPTAITVDTSGRFVYTANFSSDNISVFTISQETGGLTTGTPIGAGTGPTAIITMGTNP